MSNHSFDIHVASEYKSIEIAILVWHFQYWIMKNKRLNRNCIEGRTWTYQTYEEIASAFPYWSRHQVKRLLKKCTDLGIILKSNFNKTPFDQTLWYAFENEDKFGISMFSQMEQNEGDKNDTPSIGRNRPKEKAISPIGKGQIARPIPDTIPYTLTNKERGGSATPPTLATSFSDANEENTDALQHKVNYQNDDSETNCNYQCDNDTNINNPKEVNLKNHKKNKSKSGEEGSGQSVPCSTELALFLYEKLKSIHPTMKEPKLASWQKQLEKLKERTTESDIKNVIEYIISTHHDANSNKWWATNIQAPTSLDNHFSKILAEMNNKKQIKNDAKENEKFAQVIYDKYQKILNNELRKGYNYLEFISASNSIELKFDQKDFVDQVKQQLKIRKIG
jgi:hypothetical protein